MKEYTSILDSVICISEIKKITIVYNNGTNYSNKWVHTLDIEYKNGTKERFSTTDISKAKSEYEEFKSALLNYERGSTE